MKTRVRTSSRRRGRRNPYKVLCIILGIVLAVSIIQNYRTAAELEEAIEQTFEAVSVAKEAQRLAQEALNKVYSYENTTCTEPMSVTETEKPEVLRTITVKATAYCPCVSCCGVWSEQHPSRVGTDYVQKTSSGTIPTEGRTIATDPEVIPYGTHVLINGHEYIAEDTGSGVKGNHIDIFFSSHEAAVNWGVQTVEVSILAE